MNPAYALNEYCATEVEEVSTITCEADVAGSLAGESFKFTVSQGIGNTDITYQVYFVVGGSGANPTLGSAEISAITCIAEGAQAYTSKYFTLHNGPAASETDEYVYFTLDGAGYDPKLGQYEISAIKLIKDTGGNLDGTYFSIYSGADQQYYVWYSLNGGGTDPDPGSIGTEYGIEVIYETADSATRIAELTARAINNHAVNNIYFTALHQHHTTHSTAQVMTWAAVADVGGNLGGKYFTFGVPTASLTDAAYQTRYCVWFDVDDGNTAPALEGYTMLEVDIAEDDIAGDVGAAAVAVIDALTGTGAAGTTTVTITNTYKGVARPITDGPAPYATGGACTTTTDGIDPTIQVTNDDRGNPTTAVNGDVPAGTNFSVLQAGVDAVGGLAAFTLAFVCDISEGDTDTEVCTALTADFVAAGYSATARAGGSDHITDVTAKVNGDCTDWADGNIGGAFAIAEGTAGVDATASATLIALSVAFAEGATAAAIATACAAAIAAFAATTTVPALIKLVAATTSTADLILTNRRGGDVAAAADVDTGWASFVQTANGTDVRTTNMGQDIAAANYYYKPANDKGLYVRRVQFMLGDSAVTDPAKFGALVALTNGFNINVCELDGTVKKKLAGPIKTNGEISTQGIMSPLSTTDLFISFDLEDAFGQEVYVDGFAGEYIEIDVDDNLNGLTGFYADIQGHERDLYEPAAA